MPHLERLKRTTQLRVPAASGTNRKSTDEFLEHFERRLNRSLDEHRQLLLTNDTPDLRGQIAYWRHAVKAIKWLRAMNTQRRNDA